MWTIYLVAMEEAYVDGSLETVSSKYCDIWEDNDNEQEDNQGGDLKYY